MVPGAREVDLANHPREQEEVTVWSKPPREIAREYFPDRSDDDLDMTLFEYTGFPGFWQKQDGETPEECLRTQLQRLVDMGPHHLCYECLGIVADLDTTHADNCRGVEHPDD